MRSLAIFLTLSCQALCSVGSEEREETCSRDDPVCRERTTSQFVDVEQQLATIEKLSGENLNRAYDEIKSLQSVHAEHPQVIFLLSKIQRKLYSKLHVKMRDVGKIELLNPSLQNLQKILSMPEGKVTNKFHAEVIELSVNSALSSGNKTLSVEVIESALKRPNKEISNEEYK